ncbi:MAG: efflux RND transporter periplasmic adaptor subunit [Bacteroidetes bacterium]|nr:MAG: efflux RND transporter periplasmic adaptor subunit [Bacteroidota bacterium]
MKLRYIISFLVSLFLLSCSENAINHSEHEGHDGTENMVILTKEEIIKANIQIDTMRVKNISEQSTLTGTVVFNETQVTIISSRVKGRLERVYVRNTGEYISKGKLLYDIYSEELLADENDYLIALELLNNAKSQKETAKQLADGARKKLLQWTITEEQIQELEKTNKPSATLSFFSHTEGYITELSVHEGEYVEIGTPIAKISDLGTMWIEVQVYGDEVKFLRQNPKLSVEFEVYPGKLFSGEIVFDNPALETNQKVNLIRVKVDNKENKLRPGMMAYIYLKRNEKRTLVIPKSSLLVEKMISVWVQTSDGMFEPRMVTTGIENKIEIEILSGLKEGDIVVISGAFLLKSEQTIKQSSNSMGGMQH